MNPSGFDTGPAWAAEGSARRPRSALGPIRHVPGP
jgi:hypothetical protein